LGIMDVSHYVWGFGEEEGEGMVGVYVQNLPFVGKSDAGNFSIQKSYLSQNCSQSTPRPHQTLLQTLVITQMLYKDYFQHFIFYIFFDIRNYPILSRVLFIFDTHPPL
jgi:hypothetical protein